ncbi:MAG TPA: transketolase C-terminal domain-containing protein, partial [Tepidiformaceae bacterium]
PTDLPMQTIPVGEAEVLRRGKDVSLVGFGAPVMECMAAAEILAGEGIEATVVNARFAKPLDETLLLRLATETGGIITAEENVRTGGFGDAVLDRLADNRLADRFLGCISMPDAIVDHGPQKTFRAFYALDGAGIAARARQALAAAGDDRSPQAPLARV